jgi:phosphate/sulfate permease
MPAQQSKRMQLVIGAAHGAFIATGIGSQGGLRRVALSIGAKAAQQGQADLFRLVGQAAGAVMRGQQER